MLLDWIMLAIFGICVVICAVIIWRKLPTLASIRIDSIPKHQQAVQKKALLDKRLQTKLGDFETAVGKLFKIGFYKIKTLAGRLISHLKILEKQYHRKVISQQAIENPDTLRSKMVGTLNEAQNALTQGDLNKAEQLFIDVISMDAKNLDAYIGLADVAIAKKAFANAKEALNYVLKLQQDRDAAYTRLGRIATDEGNLSEAEADYLKSVSLNASTASTQFSLGEIEEKLGIIEKAEKAFVEAVKLEPANPKYLDGLIQFAIRQKNIILAKKTLDQLKEANSDNQKLSELADAIKNLK